MDTPTQLDENANNPAREGDVKGAGHHPRVGWPHSEAEGPIAEAERCAARFRTDEHRLDRRTGRRHRPPQCEPGARIGSARELVIQRITRHPISTGTQQVITLYNSTAGTPTAAGKPNAASPPISAASTAPTPPGVGADEASVPPTMVTMVTAMNVTPPPKASTPAHNAPALPTVVVAQPKTIIVIRAGSWASLARSAMTSLSLGRTVVCSHRRSAGTNRNAPASPSAKPATRYSTVADGTKCDRSAEAPAATLKMISSTTWVMTCTACCMATAAVARTVLKPLLCRNRTASARPPTPAGVVVAAKV